MKNFHPWRHGSRNLQMLRSSVRTGRTETSWLPSMLPCVRPILEKEHLNEWSMQIFPELMNDADRSKSPFDC
ncbi:hypothetical protein OIU77_018109 [Salix suchowensis]|uniref:Uncharacterized protein n=1 Tax=Salix suchowensis TaxID=1278906 RepID=A0ABQ8ZR39_9ROSI|nr:hypothetical protein OIU77_018109 [Salix suchowensis]